jgi:hypothetical protein
VVLESGAIALRVALLDPLTGAEMTTSEPIPIRDWDAPTLAPWGEPLWTDVRIEGGRAHLAWEVSINGWSGGATIGPYGASGGADVDLSSGAVSLAPTKRLDSPKPIRTSHGPLVAVVGGRKFALRYAGTVTLVATDAKSGKQLWTRKLWRVPAPDGSVLRPGL